MPYTEEEEEEQRAEGEAKTGRSVQAMTHQQGFGDGGESLSSSSSSCPFGFELRCLDTVALESEPRTMTCVEGVIFVGLQSGVIKAFMTNGEIKELRVTYFYISLSPTDTSVRLIQAQTSSYRPTYVGRDFCLDRIGAHRVEDRVIGGKRSREKWVFFSCVYMGRRGVCGSACGSSFPAYGVCSCGVSLDARRSVERSASDALAL